MFSSKGCYKRVNKIHERSLRLILNDYKLSFDSLLSTLNEKTIHQRCINILLTEAYKYLNGYSPDFMNDGFYLRPNHYNLRNFNYGKHYPPKLRTVHHCSSLKIKLKFGAVMSMSDLL